MITGSRVWVPNPAPESLTILRNGKRAKMFMSREQFQRLADADGSTVRMCFHGIRVHHECECIDPDFDGTPVYMLRFVGHIIDDEFEHGDRASTADVPEHRELTVDLPMSPELLRSFADSIAGVAGQASACEMMSGLTDVDKISDIFRAMFSNDEDDDENGESI